MQLLSLPTEFAREALIPLGMGVQCCRTAPVAFVPELLVALSDVADTDLCYRAAFAVSCLPQSVLAECANEVLPLLLAVLANESQAAKTRRAVIKAFTTVCEACPETCISLLPAFRTWIECLVGSNLELVLADDRGEGVLLAVALAEALAMELRLQPDEDTALVALNLYLQMLREDEEFMLLLAPAAITVAGAIADTCRDILLDAIMRNEDAGQYLVILSQVGEFAESAQRVLDALGFQEDPKTPV
jgi:hypothetical protein